MYLDQQSKGGHDSDKFCDTSHYILNSFKKIILYFYCKKLIELNNFKLLDSIFFIFITTMKLSRTEKNTIHYILYLFWIKNIFSL